MAKFRKKPVVIEALLWTGGNLDDVMAFCCGDATYEQMASGSAAVIIKTLEGQHVASVGDWIIRGINGEFYPCKPDIFEKTYEAVE